MTTDSRISPNALTLLLITSAAESLLSLYQWMELLVVRSGGSAVCSINETVNCATVWNSGFASRVHSSLGMPVAGLGLVWGLTAFGLSVLLARRVAAGGDQLGPTAAAKLWGALGALSCITFGVASMKIGAVCLTCLGTYALTIGFALPALLLLPGGFVEGPTVRPAVMWIGLIAAPVFLVLLWPGANTPKAEAAVSAGPRDADVEKFFATLPWAESQAIADARAHWRAAPVVDASAFKTHERYGPPNAPVRIVEFTDVRCPHCAALLAGLDRIKHAVPADNVSIEPRYFPLDSECNHKVRQSSEDGVRCLGAKVQICLEGTPQFWPVRQELFENQSALTKEKVLEIAAKGMPLEKLQACVAAPETQARIDEDVQYALLFNPEGTPIVSLNGKSAEPAINFLYGMAMSKGDPDTKYFAKLPAPR